MTDVKDKTIVITGAAGTLCSAIARDLAEKVIAERKRKKAAQKG